jgi:hypothetical protein
MSSSIIIARSARLSVASRRSNAPALLFTCPTTRIKIQQWENDDAPDNEYEAISCQACGKLHLLNAKTGKLLGAEEEE